MRILSTLIARCFTAGPVSPASDKPVAASARLSSDEQMSRLSHLVSASAERTLVSNHCHTAAENQLDAAAYALRELMRDLATVMTLPERRYGAELRQLRSPPAVVLARRRIAAAA